MNRLFARPATNPSTGRGDAMPRWHSPSNWDEIGSDCPAWGLSPVGRHVSATATVGRDATHSFQARNSRQLPQEALDFRSPGLALLFVRGTSSADRPLQPENQITGSQIVCREPKRLASLPLDRVAQCCIPRQALRHYPSEPGNSVRGIAAEVQIETLTPDDPSHFHHRREFAWTMQTLRKTKRGFVFRLRDDDDPWHDAHGSQHDHRGYACALGSRGCVCGAQPKAGRCVSWQNPLFKKSGGLQPFAVILSSETALPACG